MVKDIRVKRPIDDSLLFRCYVTGTYLSLAVVHKSKAYVSFLACLISNYAKACTLKGNGDKTADEVKQSIRDEIAASQVPGDDNDESVKTARASLSSQLSQWDGLLEDFPLDKLGTSEDPSVPFSAAGFLKNAASFNPVSSEDEGEKPKKPASYLYVFHPSERIPKRIDLIERPIYIPVQIPKGAVNGGTMRVDQDNKSINVQIYYDDSESDLVSRSYADYFENCLEYGDIGARGVVYVQSATLLKMVVDDKISAQRKKDQEEHERKKAEAKAKKEEEKKRKLEEEAKKPKPAKGRKTSAQ